MRSSFCFESSALEKCRETTYNAADKEYFEDGQEWKITAEQHGLFGGANGEDLE